MNAANSAVGSTPAARTTPDVYDEIVRTPSAPRSPRRASASATGASALRSGEPYSRVGRGGIAVDICDNPGPRASQPPAEKHEGGFLGALRENGVRLEGAQLSGDAERQQRVERGTVERTRPHTTHEHEPRIGPAAACVAREDPDVELGRQRIELLVERGRQREGVSRPPDHEQLPPHADAAFASSSSIRVKTASSEYLFTDATAASASRERSSGVGVEAARPRRRARPDHPAERAGRSRRRARPLARRRPRLRSPGSPRPAPP